MTPALTSFNGRLWVFWADGNQILYRSDEHTGPTVSGSCAGGTGALGESGTSACNEWAPTAAPRAVPLPISEGVRGIAAIEWSGHLVLAFTTATGRLFVARAPTNSGDLLNFATIPSTPVRTDLRDDTELELSVMYVTPTLHPLAGYPSSTLLAMFVVERDPMGQDHFVWHWTGSSTPESAVWTRRPLVDHEGTWRLARRAPGVTVWPARGGVLPDSSDFGFACGVFGLPLTGTGESRDRAEFACFDRTADVWRFGSLGASGIKVATRKPSIAYHTLREAPQTGNAPPLGPNPTRGQFWMVLGQAAKPDGNDHLSRIYVSREITSDTAPQYVYAVPNYWDVNVALVDYFWSRFTQTRVFTGVPLHESGALSALKGAFLFPNSREPGDQIDFDRVYFLPFVDGTFHAQLRDVNDFRVMERGICLSLRAQPGEFEGEPCGPKNASGF